MKESTKQGLRVLEAALLLALVGDALLRATPWGLNVFLWVGLLVAAAAALARRRGVSLLTAGDGHWLLPSVLLFAAAFAWRDSLMLKFLDASSILVLLSLSAYRARGGRVRLAGATEYALSLLVAGFNAAFGIFPLILRDIGWSEIPRNGRWSRHAWSVGRGLVIAAPVVVVFGALLMAADAVYDGLVRHTFAIDAQLMMSHAVLFVFLAWITGGFLRGMLFGAENSFDASRRTILEAVGLDAGINNVRVTPAPAAAKRYEPVATTDRVVVSPGSVVVDDDGAATKDEGGAPGRVGQTSAPPSVVDEAETHDAGGTSATSAGDATAARHEAAQARSGDARGDAAHGATKNVEVNNVAAATPPKIVPPGQTLSLGIVEIGTVLGLVNLLFFSFVAVQVRYFFGGAEWVLSSAGLTYAEYARRGFFELVWVAALVLPLLLAAHYLLRKDNAAHERVFRVLAGVQVALLFVIMASAVRRMRLYQSEYGLTELRVYTTAFMCWLALVFVWFAATVLRGARQRFACGALVAALLVAGALHFLNPDNLIVRTNAALATERGRAFDARYAASLSADAVPALLEALPSSTAGAGERAAAISTVLERWSPPVAATDWRTWNWSRAEAWRAVRAHEASLNDMREAHLQQQLRQSRGLHSQLPLPETGERR